MHDEHRILIGHGSIEEDIGEPLHRAEVPATFESQFLFAVNDQERIARDRIERFDAASDEQRDFPELGEIEIVHRRFRRHPTGEEQRSGKGIGKSVEAQLIITASDPAYSVLRRYADQLRYLFIVSQVDFFSAGAPDYKSELIPSFEIWIHKADGKKCERCWNYSIHVGENARYPTICERCSAALAEIGGATA